MIDRAHDLPITKQRARTSAVAASTTCRGRCRKPTLRRCGVSTDCIWSSCSPEVGCSEAFWRPKAADRPPSCEDTDAADGYRALYRRPRTTKPEPGHDYPSAARRRDHTAKPGVGDGHYHITMARGFVYLAVVLDWFSRRVLSWRVSITMEAAFCVEALEDALARYGKPEIFNTIRAASSPVRRSLAC